MRRFAGVFILFFGIIVLPSHILAQGGDTLDPKISKEVAAFRQKIGKEKSGGMNRQLWITFRVDTFTIQKSLEKRLQEATERYDSGFAWSDAISAYNEMIGKYYGELLDTMIEVDRQFLEESQQRWLGYKQAEQVLNQIIGRKEYNKSGLVNEGYEYQRMFELNKDRAVELFRYLARVNNR